MNILLLNYEYPPIGGGAGTATYNYAQEFVKLRHNVVIITSAFGSLYEYNNNNGVHLYRVPALRMHQDRSNPLQMLAYNFSSILFSKKIINRHKINHVIAFMSIPSGITAYIIKKLFAKEYMIFLGGGDVPGSQIHLNTYHKVVSPIRKAVLRNAKHIIACSDGLGKLSYKTDKYPTTTITVGVDIDYFKPRIKADNKVVFVFVGRFSLVKNVEYIIKEFALLAKEYENVHLNLVGDGPFYEQVYALHKELRIEDKVTFFGWVDKAKVRDIYNQSDCIINSSDAEGLSNTNLEAMSSGLAAIVSDVTGNNDLIVHETNGLLFPLKDGALYEAMKRITTDKELLNTLKKKSREEVCKNYTMKRSAQNYIDLMRG